MTHIEQMIQDMCPNGVEFKTLGEVCEMKRGSTITANQAEDGDIPVIAGGQKPAYFHNQSNREGKNITVAGSGAYAGYVAYWEQPIFVSDAFTVTPKEAFHDIKFVYYFLTNIQDKIYHTKKGSGVPHVHPSSIAERSCKRSCKCVVSSMSTIVPNYLRHTRIAILLTKPMMRNGNGKHWGRFAKIATQVRHLLPQEKIFGRMVRYHG